MAIALTVEQCAAWVALPSHDYVSPLLAREVGGAEHNQPSVRVSFFSTVQSALDRNLEIGSTRTSIFKDAFLISF